MPKESFIVDAALLQELGERLVGRPAIALGELVKNAYDADATTCRIEFADDRIVVSDNGTGMADEDFRNHWMRIATTHKVDQRVSQRFKRPLTGSKGIGRLAAQFLADELTLDSTPRDKARTGVHARVDWRSALRGTELREVTVDWRRKSEVNAYPADSTWGTRIELTGLKTQWDASELSELGNDVWMLRSPFRSTAKSGASAAKTGEFIIEIEAPDIADSRQSFDRALDTVFANWKARIRGRLEHGRRGGKGIISVDFKKGYPTSTDQAGRSQITVPLPVSADHRAKPLIDRTSFEILIFKPEGKQAGGVAVGDLRKYLSSFGNVSVYDAGFRLPYYGSKKDKIGEDWLAIAADQGRRLGQSGLLPEHLQTQNKYMEDLPAPGRIFGAVDIDTNHERQVAASSVDDERIFLQIQSGRDRLHDNEAFYQLRDLVRYSVDYYANRYRGRKVEASERARPSETPSAKLDRAVAVLEENRTQISPSVYRVLNRELSDASKARKAEEKFAEERVALLAPLASAGMTALALNHEISRESAFLGRIGRRLRQLASKHSLDELSELAAEFAEAKRRLDSVRELFAPLLTSEDRSATDRLRVQVILKQVVTGMSILMPGVNIDLRQIPADLRFPLGAVAEWSAILQNVFSNAWNAMLNASRREVSVSGGRDNSHEWLRVSDTGQGLGVPLSESPRLFEPFERKLEISPDKRSIAIGGQGLGLTIVRMLARRRKVTASFIEPPPGFSTTFQLIWRRPKA
jgi:signal transduction histidine kinase